MKCGQLKLLKHTAQKMKFSIKDWKIRIWSHLLKKSLMENLIFCPVTVVIRFLWSGYLKSILRSSAKVICSCKHLISFIIKSRNGLNNVEDSKQHYLTLTTTSSQLV